MKKVVSILLCLVMVLGLLPMAAFAADSSVTVTITADKATAAAGDTITYTVAISAVTGMDSGTFYVVIPDGLTVGAVENTDALKNAGFVGDGLYTAQGILALGCYGGTLTSTTPTTLGTFTCTVAADTHGDKVLTLMVSDDYVQTFGAGNKAFGVELTADTVNIPKTSYTPKTLDLSYTGTLAIQDKNFNGTAAATISGTDTDDEALPASELAKVTYTVDKAWAAVAADGTVSIKDIAAAEDDNITVTAKLGTVTTTATVAVTKAAPAVASVMLAADNKTTALIPTGDTANTYTYKVDVKDQYGAAMDVDATWTAGTLPTGVIFDAATATLSVTKDAESGKVTLTVTVDETSRTIEVNVTNISFSGVADGVKATAGTYGDKLGDLVKIDATKLKAEAGGAVAGKYTLKDADTVPNAGTANYQVLFTSNDNSYKDVVVTEGTVEVAQKEVTVTVSDVTVKIGTDMPELTDATEFNWTATKLVGDDKVEGTASYEFYLLGDDGEPAGTATPYADITSDEAAEYAIVATGLSVGDNYDLKIVSGTLTIRKKNLSSAPLGPVTPPYQQPDDDKKGDETKGTFEDVTAEDWFYDAVEFVAEKKLFNGTSATTFSPNANMTRAMVATVIYRLDGANKGDVAAAFEDVAADTWYTDGVAWAAEKGVVTGYSETVFAPDDNVTREQLAAMLYRYVGAPEVDAAMGMAGFNDVDAISDWAANAMRWAVQNGIINGKNGGMLDPAGNATRAEVATMLQRFVEKFAK